MILGGVELREGRWQDVLTDVESVDVLLTDPPYSPKTHEGEKGLRRAGPMLDAARDAAAADRGKHIPRNGITYSALSLSDVNEFTRHWSGRVAHWVIIFGDDLTFRWWKTAWRLAGWYVFGPVRWVKKNPPPRYSGDGPTQSTEDIMIARRRVRLPKERQGSRRGHYDVLTEVGRKGGASGVVGQKDAAGIVDLLYDYTLAGDLVCDPFSGSGTTARACQSTGRRFVGAEMDPATHRLATERLRGWGPSETKTGQRGLFA